MITRNVARKLHTKRSVRDNFETGMYRRVRFRSCGTVGYGPTMWVKSRRSGDILLGHDSKACQKGSLSIMSATTSVPRARGEENYFPARWTRRTNRQSSRPSVATGMSSAIVTGSLWQSCKPRCFHKQGIISAYNIYRSQERLSKPMERKMCLSNQTTQRKGRCVYS